MNLDRIGRDLNIRAAKPSPPVGARAVVYNREVSTSVVRDGAPRASPFPADTRPWREEYLAALGDARVEWKEAVSAGDFIVRKYRVSGTHATPLFGIAPSGRAVSFDMFSARAIDRDGTVEEWSTFDAASLLAQIRD
ncbi:MAG: ester cyclase [Gemmatimonadaceae bacterium]